MDNTNVGYQIREAILQLVSAVRPANKIQDADDNDTKIVVNDDDTIDVYSDGTQVAHIYDSGIIDWYKQSGCEAKLTANQTITSGTWTKLNITSVWDLQGEFDNTNHRWTCTKAGKYLVAIGQTISGVTDGKAIAIQVAKNGSGYRPKAAVRYGGAESYPGLSAAAIIDMAVGDYLEMQVYQDTGSNQTALAGNSTSWFAVFKLS